MPQALADGTDAGISALDPATKILEIRVCDPAMGSGHFLVTLVDYLADRVLEAMAEAEAHATWAKDGYRSPLTARIAKMRARILKQAKDHKWTVGCSSTERLFRRSVTR